MRKAARFAVAVTFILLLVAGGALLYLAASIAGWERMPDIQTPLTSTFYDRNGEVIATRFEQNRFAVSLSDLPDYVPNAFIAIEDQRFIQHFGIDIRGLVRALFRNLQEGRIVEGQYHQPAAGPQPF